MSDEKPNVEQPEKRRPGRPVGSKTGAGFAGAKTTEDVTDHSNTTAPENRNKRGRKGKKREADPESLEELASKIKGLHQLAYMATGLEDVLITDKQAGMLAASIDSVSREFGVMLSGKTGAIIGMVLTMAMIYAPKVFIVMAKIDAMKKAKASQSGNVVDGKFSVVGDAATGD